MWSNFSGWRSARLDGANGGFRPIVDICNQLSFARKRPLGQFPYLNGLVDHGFHRIVRIEHELSIEPEVGGLFERCRPETESLKLPEVCVG